MAAMLIENALFTLNTFVMKLNNLSKQWMLIVFACLQMTILCAQTQESMTFEAYIDGSDYVHVQGNNVWYVHRNYQLPGRWNGAHEPTYINGNAWQPKWDGDISSKYSSLKPPLSTAGIS